MSHRSPFHVGEQEVQARLAVRDDIEPLARQIVRPYLPERQRIFYESLPFVIAAARDATGRPWATLLAGEPGFVRSPDAGRLAIDSRPVPGDALEGALIAGADLGLLGIEFETRRRNRVNGRVALDPSDVLLLEVDQAYGNCPQYIRERAWKRVQTRPGPNRPRRATRLTKSMREWIAAADTFFIATGYRGDGDSPSFGMDASHRGGEPGFIRVESDTELVFPDYAGNNYFNTIGNLILDPRAGLLFVDFERGSLLQLTGRASIDWDSERVAHFPGARRLVSFSLDDAVQLDAAIPLRWCTATDLVHSLRLVEKQRESDDVISLVFETRDGGALAGFQAGQHLPIELRIPGHAAPVRRTYSLSNAPRGDRYRITVKREPFGLASRHLHDRVQIGAFVDAGTPAGEFILSGSGRPVVLISAGIGITPIVSMLHALTADSTRQPVWFVHGARDGRHHPLANEVRLLGERHERVTIHVAYSRPRPEDKLGVDYDSAGRVDAALITHLMPNLDGQFYLCGPTRFMADLQHGLIKRDVSADRIHTETFGPVG